MPLSYDVRLPKARTPIFPNRCVVCGQEEPGSFVRVRTHAIGWWTIAFMHWGSSFGASVPACPSCARRFRRQRWLRFAVLAVCVVPAVGAAMYLVGSYRGPFRKWLGVGTAVLFLTPLFLWEAFHAPSVDLTAYAESVDYEFADAEYAAEFAELNDAKIT